MFQRFYLLVFLLWLGCCQVGLAQPAAWQKATLDTVATIDFPGPATRQQVQGHEVYLYKADSTIYMVLMQPTSSLLGMVANNNDQFNEGVVKGLLDETGGKLLHKSAFQVSGFSGIEVQFTTPNKPQLPATKFTRVVMVNGTVYTLNYWTNAGQNAAAVAERNQFFASFQVRARPATVGDGAYKAGKILGRYAVYGLLLVGIILLVRRLSKPKKSIN